MENVNNTGQHNSDWDSNEMHWKSLIAPGLAFKIRWIETAVSVVKRRKGKYASKLAGDACITAQWHILNKNNNHYGAIYQSAYQMEIPNNINYKITISKCVVGHSCDEQQMLSTMVNACVCVFKTWTNNIFTPNAALSVRTTKINQPQR